MNRQELIKLIQEKQSYLCVGLDTDRTKLPPHLLAALDPLFEFNKQIIDATREYCVAYKINTAFYEAEGQAGWAALEKTVRYIGNSHFTIADAKRGDIGNTSTQYARAFFETLPFDSITVAPYMGQDSVSPFLQYPGKWAIVLGLTSNAGAADFELRRLEETPGQKSQLLYEQVMKTVAAWGSPENLMFVVGATQAEEFRNIRALLPEHFFLVPGVGAQGGSLREISEKALIGDAAGLLVNSSRAIIYASSSRDFAHDAATVARQYQEEMSRYLQMTS